MYQQKEVLEIFLSAVESVLPENLIKKNLLVRNGQLSYRDVCIHLADFEHIYLIGFGKASAQMARTMEELLGNWLTGGHILTKYNHSVELKKCSITEAGHPIPDQNGIEGSKKIRELAEKATEKDLILVLVSGGGSSLLTDLPGKISLKELTELNKLLVNSGASIQEINTVRKHLSQLKGGQLARLAYPATLLSFLISDVTGDAPEVIASGPTVQDPTTFEEALQVLQKYQLRPLIAPSILNYLESGKLGEISETVKAGDPSLSCTRNFIVGNNRVALNQAKIKATKLGYETKIISCAVEGDVESVANYLFSEIISCRAIAKKQKTALLFGGEPTVKKTGGGKGGRNQHLALLMAEKLKELTKITFLSAGTDGTDGPTDATGAICDGTTIQRAIKLGLNPAELLANFDSYTFFSKVGGQILTGPTNTNVMDLMILLLDY